MCHQLGEKIQQETNIPNDYMLKLQKAPDLIRGQANASLNTIENKTGLNLLITVVFSEHFFEYMKDLDQAYSKYSLKERMIINQKQLAPFQISLLAKNLALAPGIIKQYEEIKNEQFV